MKSLLRRLLGTVILPSLLLSGCREYPKQPLLPITRPGEEVGRSPIHVLLRETGEGAPQLRPEENWPGTAFEAYSLRVTPDGAWLEADGRAGIFYGLTTVTQLIPGTNGSADADLMAHRVARSQAWRSPPWTPTTSPSRWRTSTPS